MKIHGTDHDGQVECKQEDRLLGHDREIGVLNKIVILGNGKPSLVTQVSNHDQTIRALCWLVAITCSSVIGQIVFLIFRGKA